MTFYRCSIPRNKGPYINITIKPSLAVVCFSAGGVPLPPDNHTLIVNAATGVPLHNKWTHPSGLGLCGWQQNNPSSATQIIHQ